MRNTFLERVAAQRESEQVGELSSITMKRFRVPKRKRISREKIMELRGQGLTQKAIAIQLDCRAATISDALKAQGVVTNRERTPKATLALIAEKYRAGIRQRAIARELGVSLDVVHRTCSRWVSIPARVAKKG